MNRRKIAIIGGGLGGLSAAYFLSKKGNKVTIFEKEKFLGGLAAGFKIEGTTLDQSYRHIFKTDKDLIALIKELGLENKLRWYNSSTSLYWQGKIWPFMTPIDLLKFKPLNLYEKIRMGIVALWLEYDKNWQKYEKVPAYEWMKKWVGKRAYEVVWEPLLKGKFDKDYKKVSMAWLWARIHTRGNSSDKKGEERLGYFDGGFQILVDKLVEKIKNNGGIFNLGIKVNCLRKFRKEFDLIIDTRPIKKIDYLGMITLVFSSEQDLGKYYWNNINDLKSPFVALIQHTKLVDKTKYNNKNIYYLGTYLSQKSKYFKMRDKKIEDEWLSYLKNIFSKFDRKKIREIKVFKSKTAQHIVGLNYQVPKYWINKKTYRMNFAQIYPQDRGMNYAVKETKKVVRAI
jgi:protoporphyrinogen oxidase